MQEYSTMGNKAATSSSTTPTTPPPLYDESIEHYVRRGHFYRHSKHNDTDLGALPPHHKKVVLAAGCFWGTEKAFWRLPGVYATAVGYIAGNDSAGKPSYRKVCSGKTGHAEATLVIYDPTVVSLTDLLRLFFACHDPTQGDGQGNDRGSQYRSGIYVTHPEDETVARDALRSMGTVLARDGFANITTEIQVGRQFWYAEAYHQCYLAKPGNRQYCSAEPTGRTLPRVASNLLPDAFWTMYDFSIQAPHGCVAWGQGSTAVERELEIEAALAKAQVAQAAWALKKTNLEQESGVIIRYCGGCGFAHRAKELQEYLDASVGVRPALLRDNGATGNFDVSVRTRPKGGKPERGKPEGGATGKGKGTAATENETGGAASSPASSPASPTSPTFELIHSKKTPLRGLVQVRSPRQVLIDNNNAV